MLSSDEMREIRSLNTICYHKDMVKRLLNKWRKWRFPYTPLVEITISKERLLGNLHIFQNLNSNLAIAPVLKSNAYGHGLALVAKIVDAEKIAFIIVDSYHEAMILRNEGVKSPILIVGYTALDNILKNKLRDVAFTIVSLEQLEEISKNLTRPTQFHIKIDTGMRRQGILVEDLNQARTLIRTNKSIELVGICSHLGDSESVASEITKEQIEVWNRTVENFRKEFSTIKYWHLSATGGSLYTKEITANVLRLGIGLYGIDPSEHSQIPDLKPVLEMKSIISGTKNISKGDKIGYSATFEATTAMRIATVPAGYYEGIDRRLSSKGFVKIGQSFCPIVGRVSMNITTIDISSVPEVKLGTPVILISNTSANKNSIENMVKTTGALERELLVHIPQQLRRKIV